MRSNAEQGAEHSRDHIGREPSAHEKIPEAGRGLSFAAGQEARKPARSNLSGPGRFAHIVEAFSGRPLGQLPPHASLLQLFSDTPGPDPALGPRLGPAFCVTGIIEIPQGLQLSDGGVRLLRWDAPPLEPVQQFLTTPRTPGQELGKIGPDLGRGPLPGGALSTGEGRSQSVPGAPGSSASL